MSSPGCQTRSMSSPIRRRSILSRYATARFMSRIFGSIVCLRANASSCRVKSADFDAAFLISFIWLTSGVSAADLCRINSQWPIMTPSILLKSCAMPPARRPIDSIFLDCASSSRRIFCRFSAFLCSVMSVVSSRRTFLPSGHSISLSQIE